MSDRVEDFFEELARRGHEPQVDKMTGTVRFDLEDGDRIDHWLLSVQAGDLTVFREERPADCVVHAERAYFERVIAGESKLIPGIIRNDFMVEGDLRLFFNFERLLPGPSGARDPRTAAAAELAAAGRRQP